MTDTKLETKDASLQGAWPSVSSPSTRHPGHALPLAVSDQAFFLAAVLTPRPIRQFSLHATTVHSRVSPAHPRQVVRAHDSKRQPKRQITTNEARAYVTLVALMKLREPPPELP